MNSGRPGSQRHLAVLLALISSLSDPWPVIEQADVARLCGLTMDEALAAMEALEQCARLETAQGPETLVAFDLDREDGFMTPANGPGPWIGAPLRLNRRETRALEEALTSWGVPIDRGIGESLLEAYGAPESGLCPLPASEVEDGRSKPLEANLEAQNLVSCSRALLERRRLRFPYQSQGPAPRDREVEPLDLYEAEGHWYLFGADCRVEGEDPFRLFRLDRMTDEAVVENGQSTRPPQSAPQNRGVPVKVRLSSPEPYDQGLWGSVPKRKHGDGLVVTPRLQSPSWLWARVAACGGQAVPAGNGTAADKDYRRQVVDHIDRMLAEAGVAIGEGNNKG